MSEGRGRGGCGGLMHNRRGSFVDRRKRGRGRNEDICMWEGHARKVRRKVRGAL